MTTPLTPCTAARHRARGFSLLIMLVAIALLGVFAVVATRLIRTTLGLYHEAGRVDAEAKSTDAAIRQLRADVWSAREVTPKGAQSVTIDDGTGRGGVAWAAEADGALVRATAANPTGAATADAQRWPEAGARLSFDWDGIALTVRGADRGADRAGGIRMISQAKLADAGGAK